jgi:hypothetical protein
VSTAQNRRRGSAEEAGPSATETGLVSEQGHRERVLHKGDLQDKGDLQVGDPGV